MGIEIPTSLQWVSYLAGSQWPQGDETAMFRIRDVWHASADDLASLVADLNTVRAETLSVLFGETAEATNEQFALLFDGEYSVGKLIEAMSALGDLAGETGVDIEYTKLQIIAALAVASAEIQFALAAAARTAGGSLANIPVVETVTVTTIRQLVTMLIRRTAGAVAGVLKKTAVKRLAVRGAQELALGVAIESGIQGYQVGAGNRAQLDPAVLRDVAVTSAAGSVAQKSTSTALTDALGSSRNVVSAVTKGLVANAVAAPLGSAAGAVAVGAPLDPMSLAASANVSGVKGGVRGIGAFGARGTRTPGPGRHSGPAGAEPQKPVVAPDGPTREASKSGPSAAAGTGHGAPNATASTNAGDKASRTGWAARADNLSDLRSGRPGGSSLAASWNDRPGQPGATPLEITGLDPNTALTRTDAVPLDGDVPRVGPAAAETGSAEARFGQSTDALADADAPRAAAPADSAAVGAATSLADAGATSAPQTTSGVAADAPDPSAATTSASPQSSTTGPVAAAEAAPARLTQFAGSSTSTEPVGGHVAADSHNTPASACAGAQHWTPITGSGASEAIRTPVGRRDITAQKSDAPGGQRIPVRTYPRTSHQGRAVPRQTKPARAS